MLNKSIACGILILEFVFKWHFVNGVKEILQIIAVSYLKSLALTRCLY